ncbi:MAG TPA: DPP IV N-terminal domain-containing protein [bacterium]|nr:DPP IV N-terminal domain-containing protein [bacterium]
MKTFFPSMFRKSIIFGLVFIVGMTALHAQYFGRNKVQYEDFDFKILESEHFDLYHYPREDQVAEDAAQMLERWYARYSELFELGLSGRQPIIMYANHPDFQQTNVISGMISQGTGGVTEGMRNRVVLPMTGVYTENDHVLGHELVHAFQYDIMKRRGRGLRAAQQLPLWMVEGMAEYLTIGRHDPLTAMWMRDAVLHDDVPTIRQIARNRRYFPYRYGHALWAYIGGLYSDNAVMSLFSASFRGGWQRAPESVLGISGDSLSTEWQQAIRETFGAQLQGRTRPDSVGEVIIKEQGETNLAPSVSPDGNYLAFISRRELFTLDLYLADAHTGEVIKKLASSETDVHFDALRFMDASGAWSPDSRRFAFVVIENGDNKIAILDVESTTVLRTLQFDEVDAIKHLAWSPDGQSIVFSGTEGGIGNLYMVDLQSGELTQLTDDRYAEIQPTWSPDGNVIAFTTDRGSGTDLEQLRFRSMNIGLLDPETGEIELLSIADGVKHINPQFSSAGNDLYFIANPDGFSDLYRYDFTTEEFYRVTRVATGISGLTENSPTMSVARETGRVVFSVFEDHDYNIYGLPAEQAQGEQFSLDPGAYAANTALPPVDYSSEGYIHNYLDNYRLGLQSGREYSFMDYQPQLRLLYVGQPGVGLVVDRQGVGIGGGVNFLFGDMLGNQMLSVTTQIQGQLKDLGGEILYRNRDRRWNWGGDLSHIPYRTGRTISRLDTISVNGESEIGQVFSRVIQRTFVDRLSGMVEYPFSTNRRLEFSGGYTRISYNAEVRTTETTLGGVIVDETERDLDTPPAVNLFHISTAYVGDYSYMGFTSAIDGKRFRFEIEPTVGTLRYMSALADYRHYFFKNPVTLAFRALHYGRYFGDSESDRLTPLQLGYETWVRGYEPSTFSREECSGPGCPELDRLIGSRIGVFNAELRLPLFGTEQFGLLNFPYLPTELVGFFDGGVAWTQDELPTWELAAQSTERIPVFRTGVAARFNLFGYLVGQVYFAYPFQRPEQGWHTGFVLAPGW